MINAFVIIMKIITFHYMRFLYLANLITLSKDNKGKNIEVVNALDNLYKENSVI